MSKPEDTVWIHFDRHGRHVSLSRFSINDVSLDDLIEALESTTKELRGYIEAHNVQLKDNIQCDDLDEPDWHDMQTIYENDGLLARARGEHQ